MPRKDRSFTTADWIRILARNLSRSEQDEVLLFVFLVVPDVVFDRISLRLTGEGSEDKFPRAFRRTILGVLRLMRLINQLLTFVVKRVIIRVVFDATAREEIDRAIERLRGR